MGGAGPIKTALKPVQLLGRAFESLESSFTDGVNRMKYVLIVAFAYFLGGRAAKHGPVGENPAGQAATQTVEVAPEKVVEGRKVVLLHGLARSSYSMQKMQTALDKAGFSTCNIDYPSTEHPIETLALHFVLPEIKACFGSLDSEIDFVTHSMGGILVRYLALHDQLPRIGRVVMLSPPNGGSEVVDKLGHWWLFKKMNGPAGGELGTSTSSLPLQLGAATFDVGIITGSRTVNPILSFLINGRDDGKVSVENAKLEGMTDFLVVPVSHPFIMENQKVISHALYFLQHGFFTEVTGD